MSAFNQNPIYINAPMATSFWATLRAAGVLASTQGKPIQPVSIRWIDPGASASVSITDGVGNAVLFQSDTGPDYVGGDMQFVYPPGSNRWRDFQAVVLTGGALEIEYR